ERRIDRPVLLVEAHRALAHRDGFRVAEPRLDRLRDGVIESCVLRIDRERSLLDGLEAILRASLELIASREKAEAFGIGRVDLERFREIRLRALEVAIGEPQAAEPAPRARMTRVHLESALELLLGERVAPRPDLEIDEVVLREKDERISVVSVPIERPPEKVAREREVVLLEIGAAPLDEERHAVLVLVPRLGKHDVVRVVITIEMAKRDAHLDVDLRGRPLGILDRHRLIDRDDLGPRAFRVSAAARRREHVAEPVERLDVARVTLERGSILGLRLLQTARPLIDPPGGRAQVGRLLPLRPLLDRLEGGVVVADRREGASEPTAREDLVRLLREDLRERLARRGVLARLEELDRIVEALGRTGGA